MRTKRALKAVVPVAVLTTMLGAGLAHADVISDFEADSVGGTSPLGWTVIADRFDLGVDGVGLCDSTDTSDYSTLRDWSNYAKPLGSFKWDAPHPNVSNVYGWFPTGSTTQASLNGELVWFEFGATFDKVVGPSTATDISQLRPWSDLSSAELDAFDDLYTTPPAVRNDSDFSGDASFEAQVVDGAGLAPFTDSAGVEHVLARPGHVLQLSSGIEGDPYGYVVHGPVVYSDSFTSAPGRQLSLWWAASGADDDYHVLGYLLNVDTCEQIEVLDSTGQASSWAEAVAQVPAVGTYRFVFVAGTYDQSWGGVAGGLLWIDDVAEEPGVAIPEEELPSTGAGSSLAVVAAAMLSAGGVLLLGRGRRPAA